MRILSGRYKRVCMIGVTALLCFSILVAVVTFLPVHGEREIYDAVIRLHVIANSDSEEDQTLKMRVRDAVLALTAERLHDCVDREQAQEQLAVILDELQCEAERVLREEGCDKTVCVRLGEENYPTRNYESFCFPAGTYVSLRVMIGEAAGQNFWCVLFPPLCMSAAAVEREEAEEEFIAVGLSRDQYAIITETGKTKYKIRFKFLEVFGQWFARD